MPKSFFTLLIFFAFFSTDTFCQKLHFKIEAQTAKDSSKVDSIGYFKPHQDVLSIENEYTSFKDQTYRAGFIEAVFSKLNKSNDSTFLGIVDFKKKYDSIHIYYSSLPDDLVKELNRQYSKDFFKLPFQEIEPALNKLSSSLSDLGNPFISLQLKNIEIEDNHLTAQLEINNDQPTRSIDDIVIKGYEKFPKSFIKHYLKIKRGQALNMSYLKEQVSQLDQLPFANSLKEPEILFTKDSTTLYLYIEKQNTNNFDGFIGFGTNETTNKLEFNGYLNLNLINNLNFGESFNLIYKSDQNDQRRFQVSIETPYLFQSPLGTELELRLFKKDSSFTTNEQKANLMYQFNPKHTLYVGIQGIQSENLLAQTTSSTVNDYKSTFYNVRYRYRLRQKSRLFPLNSFVNFQFGTGRRTMTEENTSQNQYLVDAFKIFNLNTKNSIYLRFNAFLFDTDSILENELGWFGGINSMRGFEENSLQANLYGYLNTEYRYTISESIYIHTIIDLGYLENDLALQKEKLYGFGLGFGLITQAGLLKFNYANGKTESQNFRFSNSQVHLSLTAFF